MHDKIFLGLNNVRILLSLFYPVLHVRVLYRGLKRKRNVEMKYLLAEIFVGNTTVGETIMKIRFILT